MKDENRNYKIIASLVPSHESNKALYEFVLPIDELEKITRINFYPNLPNHFENELEKSADYKDWNF